MSGRAVTLWGEVIVPEVTTPAGKNNAKNTDAGALENDAKMTAGDLSDEPDRKTGKAKKGKAKATEMSTTEDTAPGQPVRKAKVEKINKLELPDGWEQDKKYYSIGEVAALFKINTSHIRFWTNEFQIKVRTTRKGDRLYTEDQVRELKAIYHLVKERGFTLTGAKAKLKNQNKREVETVDLKESLVQLRNKLLIIRGKM